MSKPKNVIIAQSGGPTPVINASLRGVIEACQAYPNTFGTVYAGFHGIEGVLKEELLDLSAQPAEEIALLSVTPAAGSIGTCRYKLKGSQKEDFERMIAVFKAHKVGYFFYNGGNDSMDTAHKVAQLAHERGLDLIATGVPKTIDNDVGGGLAADGQTFEVIDHTPGFGSVARYWALTVQNANEENAGSCPSDPVLVLQAMGRKIGYIPAAARLADPHREMPLLIFMRESGLSLEALADAVNDTLKAHGRAIVVVSEGFNVGSIGERKDSFGHTMFSASETTVEQIVVNYLNSVGLAARGSARGNVPGTDQRHAMIYASTVDLEEAYRVGQKAVQIAVEVGGGFMSTLLRQPGELYQVTYDQVPLERVANSERTFPETWLTPARTDVTDDFIRYARPLIGDSWPTIPLVNGLQRFTHFHPVFAAQKLAAYTPQAYRS
ncbi:MAG TPA: diphosphate--fructose-6-phosphate 1-phosphotransferase [Anaerolineae bacterium]|nr:diphosphate--fructose-6-phosphate 1-phosphotransferase [Anaerolineae bacterium]HQH37515.1 diphosphate--fructose-6-phosphate 1-phosphotransferase [Anaerolineae bacterium]